MDSSTMSKCSGTPNVYSSGRPTDLTDQFGRMNAQSVRPVSGAQRATLFWWNY